MKRLNGPTLALAALSMAMAAVSSPATACTCDYPTFAVEFAQSAAIFRGTVSSITTAEPDHFNSVWVTLATDAWWKGAPSSSVAILTAATEASCGYPFSLGSEYIVFAYAPQPFATSLCNLTHPTFPGDPYLDLLGPPISVAASDKTWGAIKHLYR